MITEVPLETKIVLEILKQQKLALHINRYGATFGKMSYSELRKNMKLSNFLSTYNGLFFFFLQLFVILTYLLDVDSLN